MFSLQHYGTRWFTKLFGHCYFHTNMQQQRSIQAYFLWKITSSHAKWTQNTTKKRTVISKVLLQILFHPENQSAFCKCLSYSGDIQIISWLDNGHCLYWGAVWCSYQVSWETVCQPVQSPSSLYYQETICHGEKSILCYRLGVSKTQGEKYPKER